VADVHPCALRYPAYLRVEDFRVHGGVAVQLEGVEFGIDQIVKDSSAAATMGLF
jgi:hypothetical protein